MPTTTTRILGALVAVLTSISHSSAQIWYNADTSQFTSLSLNTPTAVNFLGSGDLTMTRISAIGSPILTDTWTGTFTTPVGGQPNPAWVLGTRSYFDLESNGAGSASSTVSYELDFADGLATSSQLVFIDFDWSEQVTIKAYDTLNNLIPFAATTILFSPGADSTPRYQDISWAASAGATGLLQNTNDDSESNIIASISSATPIHRLVYDFNFSRVDAEGATIRFQVAARDQNNLYVGSNTPSNTLALTNGTNAYANTYVGYAAGASNNALGVNNAGTLLTNGADLVVGLQGSGNSLVISNGGTVASASGYIGSSNAAANNGVLVTGAGSSWTNTGELVVGLNGASNRLTVADGGTLAASAISIAANAGSSGTLNIGRFGTNDTGGAITAPTIAFGDGTAAINFNQSDAVTITSVISGAGTINQLGAGTTTLSASNTYTGATTVSGGRLVVGGSIAGSTVTVNNGGTLSGSGPIGGLVINLGGTVNPGTSPVTQSVAGNVVWNAGGNYNWQIHDVTPGGAGTSTGWDLISATGILDLSALTVGSEFNINLWSLSGVAPDANGPALNFDPNQNYTWTILSAAGGISGFTGSSQFVINTAAVNGTGGFANALGGGSFSIAQSGNDLNLVFTAAGPAPIPEPGTWAAAALLASGAAFMRWRKRRTKVS